jgi:spore coat protein U domain-containing protein, fimbrial subunit CupE1/2/3/6
MKTRMGRLTAGMAAAGLMAGVAGMVQPSVEAATATSNLAVTAAVVQNCTITAGTVAFGNYDPVGTNNVNPLNANGTVTVRCTRGSNATIGLGNGLNFSGGRRMSDGGTNYLSYGLYSDSPGGTAWTDAATVAYNALNFSPQNLTVYGQVSAGQDVAVGNYSDTVVATITF